MLESSVNIVQSRAVARKLIDEITSAGRAFQSRALVTGKARLPTAESRDVGTAEVYDDHDLSRCLDGRSLTLCSSADRYAGSSP